MSARSIARPGGFRLNIQGYVGVAGSVSVQEDIFDISFDLEPTFGIQLQGLFSIGQYILVGPALSFRSMKLKDFDGDRVSMVGIDTAFGAHYAIELNDTLAIDPYLLFTLGMAIATQNEGLTGGRDIGLNLGFRTGATLWFSDTVGTSLGLGYQRAHFDVDGIPLRLQEVAIDLGLSLRFGG